MEAEKQKNTVIFSSEFEDYFMMCMNVLMVVYCFGYTIISKSFFNWDATNYFLRDYIFLNTLHVPITMVMVLFLPELRTWMERKSSSLGKFKYEAIATFLFFMILGILGHRLGGKSVELQPLIALPSLNLAAKITFILLSIYHGAGQLCGVSLSIQKSQPHILNPLSEKRERILFRFLIWSLVAFGFCTTLNTQTLVGRMPTGTDLFLRVDLILIAVFAISIFLNAFSFDKSIKTKKLFFLSFLLIYPFFGTVPFVNLAIGANHGLVYFLISKKMISNSTLNPFQKRKFYFYTGGVCLIWGFIAIPRYLEKTDAFDSTGLILLLGFLTAMDLFHYWLDRNIFRMRHKENRDLIAPLLLKQP